ncbi:MAG TPA: sugar ABC transporter substrate-binding protein [Pseudonocardiaceae bacterium]|jgi:multiple sugar transport system substrate-binding protein|nr:sugar ABC transporter substrate-binding protein [Pseudonocardiaceae bacterium]
MRLRRLSAIAAVAAAVAAVAVGCSSSSGASGSKTINWWTWDDKQAQAYQLCANAFEKANPGVTVKISQYDVEDYFTKLTAGFVAGNAPDAFQNSVQYFQAYASQGQLLALDNDIASSHLDMSQFSVGVNAWKFTDGKQYGLPLDWAAEGIYYNKDMLTKAGFTDQDVDNLTWNPQNGGTFDKMVAHLTVDKNGVRGDQPGFNKSNVATYGIGVMNTGDFTGQLTWNSFATATGWSFGNKSNWPTVFNYADPKFVQTMDYVRSLSDRGFAPPPGAFTTGNNQSTVSSQDLMGSGKVAMETDGSWSAPQYAVIPGVHVGIAPTVLGPSGKRSVESNSNGNNIWSGTKNADLAWQWVSYMGSQACQTVAGASGTFFPSIPASMNATAVAMAKKGIDLSVFTGEQKNKELYTAPDYANGAAVQAALVPMFEAYFGHQRNDDVFKDMQTQSQQLLTKK